MSDASVTEKQRVLHTHTSADGVQEVLDTLTPINLDEPKQIFNRKESVIPVIVVPGIMATRLVNFDDDAVWDLPSMDDWDKVLATFCEYLFKGPKKRGQEMDPATTRVLGPEPEDPAFCDDRGRSALYGDAYHPFMDTVGREMNALAELAGETLTAPLSGGGR